MRRILDWFYVNVFGRQHKSDGSIGRLTMQLVEMVFPEVQRGLRSNFWPHGKDDFHSCCDFKITLVSHRERRLLQLHVKAAVFNCNINQFRPTLKCHKVFFLTSRNSMY